MDETAASSTAPCSGGSPDPALIVSGKNATLIRCQRCPSIILRPGTADYVNKEIYLPHMKQKTDQAETEGELLGDHWVVNDMYSFENVGFSNTVNGTIKYLTCADCEVGPIGMYDNIGDNKMIYVSLDRVQHEK